MSLILHDAVTDLSGTKFWNSETLSTYKFTHKEHRIFSTLILHRRFFYLKEIAANFLFLISWASSWYIRGRYFLEWGLHFEPLNVTENVSNSSISRFTLRVIASLITIYYQYILNLAPTRTGQHQNNTLERKWIISRMLCYCVPPKCTKSILTNYGGWN